MNVCIVAGARPNFIKIAPLIRAIDKARADGSDIDSALIYSGKDTDATLDTTLFSDLQMRKPDVFLGVDSANINEFTGKVMAAFDRYLCEHPTDVVIVVDDLASTMASAIVTKKHGTMLAHLVAGTRSFDIAMPKEINRLVIDGLSDLLFTSGAGGSSIAAREGASISRIYMVGNILMDTLRFNHNRMIRPQILDNLNVGNGKYIVFTLNRKALIGSKNLPEMITTMADLAGNTPIIAPLRGSAAEAVRACLVGKIEHFHIIEPLNYLEFGYLTAHAKGVITDSGNVAEEATFNNVPCVTLNNYTEHVETVSIGSNVLVGEDVDLLSKYVEEMVNGEWKESGIPTSWDGRSAERIVRILLEHK